MVPQVSFHFHSEDMMVSYKAVLLYNGNLIDLLFIYGALNKL